MSELHKQTRRSCQQGAGLKTEGAKDTMTDCLRQLLEFDDGNRRATLESLSRYVAEKTGECSSTESPSNSNDSADSSDSESSYTEQSSHGSGPPGLQPPTVKGISTSQSAVAKHVSVEPPPGLENLRHSSAAFDRSRPNCGSTGQCWSLYGESAFTASGRTVSHRAPLAHQRHAPLDANTKRLTAAPNIEDKSGRLFASRKSFPDLTMDLPQEFASLAESMFSSAAEDGESSVQTSKTSMETLRRLRHYLQQQQAESMQKIWGLMHLQEQGSLQSPFPGTAHFGQWAQPQDQGQTVWAPGVPSMPPACYSDMRQVPGCVQHGNPIQQRHSKVTSTFKAARANSGQMGSKVATHPSTGGTEETMRTNLQQLQHVDCNRIVLARKINRLGFEAPAILEQHYSQFGKVERVLVARSSIKAQDPRQQPRMRPSGLGFIVMSTAEEAQAILKLGEEQCVMNAEIRVRQFERRHGAQGEAELEGKEDIVAHSQTSQE